MEGLPFEKDSKNMSQSKWLKTSKTNPLKPVGFFSRFCWTPSRFDFFFNG
jgi:hypothetical protein